MAGAMYGFARALLEIVRDDNERGLWLGVSTSQAIGVLTAIACAIVYLRRRAEYARAARAV